VAYLGIDVGSVSTDLVLLDDHRKVMGTIYLKTRGRPIQAVQEGLRLLRGRFGDVKIAGAGTTGSGRRIAATLIGADTVKNEITAHAVAALEVDPDVRTIIEIGGQDSKIIILKGGIVSDFAMNTVCAAGTGSFLDRQAERLEIPIEEFGERALKAASPVRIAGRCAVFAESDMIHKQQLGYRDADIIMGLCEALVRNYLNNVGKGKDIRGKIFFQGGVAANKGMKSAFESALGMEVIVPEYHSMMGAIGAALLAAEAAEKTGATCFKGLGLAESSFDSVSFECDGCANRCEVINIRENGGIIGSFGDRCGKWGSRGIIGMPDGKRDTVLHETS
jgi:predicted CoA-substrate-specific enzyme activase